jgi:hypothetical protein
MSTNKFDPTPLFDALPSFWKDYYKDKDVLSTVYEALLRIQEIDYNRLFTVDDSKTLSSVPVLTRYPVVYDQLNDWETTGQKHAHTKISVAFDPTLVTPFDATTQYYRIRFPDTIFKYDSQLYLDGRAIPASFYTKVFEPYYSGEFTDGETVGTTVYLHAQRLAQLFAKPLSTEDYELITEDPDQFDNYGNVSEDPEAFADYGNLGWSAIEAVTTATMYAFKSVLPLKAVTDGSTSSFELDLSPQTLSTDESTVVVESVDVTGRVAVSYDSAYTTVTPVGSFSWQTGQTFKVTWQDGTIQQVSAATGLPIYLTKLDPIASVQLLTNFQIYPSVTTVDINGVSVGNNQLYPGTIVRVVDSVGTQSAVITDATNRVTFERPIDTNTAKVFFHGIDLLSVDLTETALDFNTPPNKSVTLRIDGVISNDHQHVTETFDIEVITRNIVLANTPATGAMTGNESEFLPCRVFKDGQLLLAGTDYSLVGSILIFEEDLLPPCKVSVYYEISGEVAHTHYHQVFQNLASNNRLTIDREVSADDTFELYYDSLLNTHQSQLDLVGGRSITLDNVFPENITIVFHGIQRGWAYRHVIADRMDARYGYRGHVKSIGFIQDGLITASATLSSQDGDIAVVEENGDTVLYSNTKVIDAWMFDVDVDEQLISNVWGALVDNVEASTDDQAVRITSLLAAARSPAFVANMENFGSIVLGSRFLEEDGVSLGIRTDDNGDRVVSIRPTDTQSDNFDVQLIDGAEVRITDGSVLPRLFAVNKLLSVIDKDLSSVPWLAFMAESLSSDFRFAKRLDAKTSKKLTSDNGQFDQVTGVLTDYSINFYEEEVRVGDQIRLEFAIFDFTLPDNPLEERDPVVANVLEVINPNQIRIKSPEIVDIAGFGENSYGSGPFGGGIYTPSLRSYTVWTRVTRKLDSFYKLDTALASAQAFVSGEDVQLTNEELAKLLRHHVFVLKLNWDRMVSAEQLATLQQLIRTLKPAKTTALVYTELEDGNGIAETLGSELTEGSPELSVAGDRVADEFYTGTSYLGADYRTQSSTNTLLYDPASFTVGPAAFALTNEPDLVPKDSQYYLTASRNSMIDAGSAWATLYSGQHGLEGLLLKSTLVTGVASYEVYPVFGYRPNGFAIEFNGQRRLNVPWVYLADDFTFRTWMTVPSGSIGAGESPQLLALGSTGFRIGLGYVSASTYEVAIYPSPSQRIVVAEFSPDTETFLSVTYREDDSQFETIIAGGRNGSGTTSTDAGVTASFTGTLFLGAGNTDPIQDSGITATLDETVLLGRAASPEEVASWYSTRYWSGPLGVSANGSPLSELGAQIVLHFDKEDALSTTVFDYSGEGNNLSKESDDVDDLDSDWFVSGIIDTPLPSEKDYFQLDRRGYYITDGRRVTIPVLDEDGVPTTVEYTARSGEIAYTAPNVAYYFTGSSWLKVDAFPSTSSSAVSVNRWTGPYQGFFENGYIDPNNQVRSSVIRFDATLGTDPAFKFSAKNNAAISSIKIGGTEILEVDTKADIVQQRWEVGNSFVLAEAGADNQSPREQSLSRYVSSTFTTTGGVVRSYPAFSQLYTEVSPPLEASGDLFTKRVKLGVVNNNHILEIESSLQPYASLNNAYVGWVYQLSLSDALTEAFSFQVGTQGAGYGQPIYLGKAEESDNQIETTFKGGVILTSVDRTLAIGIYHHGPSRPNYRIATDIEYLSTPNRVLLSSTEYIRNSGGVAGEMSKKRYICAGNFVEVVSAFAELYAHLEGLPAPTFSFPAIAMQAAITSPLNQNILLNQTVDFNVRAISAYGTIDALYAEDVTATVTDITTGTATDYVETFVNGVADFSAIPMTQNGSKSVFLTSGSLQPATLSLDVWWPKPIITSITPTTSVTGTADTTVRIFGSQFYSPHVAQWRAPGSNTWVDQTTTYVSPGEVQFSLLTSMKTVGRHVIRVSTPRLLGAISNSVFLQVTASAPVWSPHYLSIDTYPSTTLINSSNQYAVSLRHSPSGNLATINSGRVTLTAQPTGSFTGTMSAWASPVNGVALINGSVNKAGIYDLRAVHSPLSGGAARTDVEYAVLTVQNPDPVLSRVSPPWFSPEAASFDEFRLFGANFIQNDSVVEFCLTSPNHPSFSGWTTRTTVFDTSSQIIGYLTTGDIAYDSTERYRYARVSTRYSVSGLPSASVSILVSPTAGVPPVPTVYSPFFLGEVVEVGSLTYNDQFVNETVDVLVPVLHSLIPLVSASTATGLVRVVASPELPEYTGSGSDSAVPQVGNQIAFLSPQISSYGRYRLSATYSPGVGETAVVGSASDYFNVYLRPATISRVSPVITSPLGTQTITITGAGFNVSNKVYLTNATASTTVTASPSFTSAQSISFQLSPGNYTGQQDLLQIQVGTPTWSYALSNSSYLTLYPTPSTYTVSLNPDVNNPPPILTQTIVVGNTLPTIDAHVFDNAGQPATSVTGLVSLAITKTTGGVAYSGADSPVNGYASFSGITAPAAGIYNISAEFSPTGGTPVTADEIQFYSLNPVGYATSVSPSTFAANGVPRTIKVYGQNFLSGSTAVLVNGSESAAFVQTVHSPKALTATLSTFASNSVGTHQISIKTQFAAPGGQPAYSGVSVPLTITANPSAPAAGSEENLPATIIVSPLGYARVRSPSGPITPIWTPVAVPGQDRGSDSLWQACINRVGQYNTANPPGTIQPTATSPGAADVVEVTAGMYSHVKFYTGNASGPHETTNAQARGLSLRQPLIIRARKTNGVAEPVVIRPFSFIDPADTTYACITFQATPTYKPGFMHFYDIGFMGRHYGVEHVRSTNMTGSVDYYYEDHQFHRCRILGTYDHRTIALAPYRVTQSTQSNVLTNQKHWNYLGQELIAPSTSPSNSFLWRMDIPADQVHRALHRNRYCVSVPVTSPADLNPLPTCLGVVIGAAPSSEFVYTSSQSVSTSKLIHLGLDKGTGGSPHYVELTLMADGENGGAGVANSRSNVSVWSGSWQLLTVTNGVVPVGTVYDNTKYPLTGRVIGGTALYPNIIFRNPGYYHFTARLLNGAGVEIPLPSPAKNIYVQATTPGISQKETYIDNNFVAVNPNNAAITYAKTSLPKLKVVNNLTSIFTLPVNALCNYNLLLAEQQPVQAPMITGTLDYTMDLTSYNAGWRWADSFGTLLSGNPRVLTGQMINGFGNVYSSPSPSVAVYGRQGLRLKYTGTSTTFLSNAVAVVVTKRSVTPAETTLTVPTSNTPPLKYTLEFVAGGSSTTYQNTSASGAWWHSVNGGYSGSTNLGRGRVFCASWPGSPNHPNYDPDTTGVFYPHPDDCPYLTYPEGRSMKQGNQVYTGQDYLWDGGFVGHIAEEHGFYFHNNRNVTVRNTLIKYTGRTGIQSLNWWQDNKPSDTVGDLNHPNNRENVSQFGYSLVFEKNTLKDCGITTPTRQLTVADYAGSVYIRNNKMLLGFNGKLRHWESINAGAIVVYDGRAFVQALGLPNDHWNIYPDHFMVDQFDNPAVDWQHIKLANLEYTPIGSRDYYPGGAVNPYIGLSPSHPYYYLRRLFENYPRLGFASGQQYQVVQNGLVNWTPNHPYYNRAYGHPRFSAAPFTKSITLTKPPPSGTGPSVSVTLGSPTVGFYGGTQKVGAVYVSDNIIWGNSWISGARPLATALSGDPYFSEFVHADWVSPGIRPQGMIALDTTGGYTGTVLQEGTGFQHPLVAFGGMRNLILNHNSIKPGNTVVGKIDLNPKQATGNDLYYPPILSVTGSHNIFATAPGKSAGFRYYFTDTTNPIVAALRSQLLSSVSPSPNLYF